MEDKALRVTMPDGSKFDIPVMVIARDRANHYVAEFDGSVVKSLEEDTLPLFESDNYEIEDWAANNMDWDQVRVYARKVEDPEGVDYQEGWVNGEKEIVDK